MRIGQVAQKYNISVETLHYWELSGVIPPVNRDASGKRDYDSEDLDWVHFAKCMRLAGVSIKCLSVYIKLFAEGHHTKNQRKQLLKKQLAKINRKLHRLQSCHDLLSWKISHYDQIERNYHGKLSNCISLAKKDK